MKKLIITIIILLEMLILITLVIELETNIAYKDYGIIYQEYSLASEHFRENQIIWNISNSCANVGIKTLCVFDKIPMIIDLDRGILPLFKSPESYFKSGGVCRDLSVLRASALKNIGINCKFIFPPNKNHVYLSCEEEGIEYVLNNGEFYVI